jgi:hypothetical protein
VENALWRNARCTEIGACDHMVVEWTYPPGPDDFLIVQENGKPRVKRRQLQMEVTATSPALPSTSRAHSLSPMWTLILKSDCWGSIPRSQNNLE